MDNAEKTTFEKLVSKMSSDERNALLAKMRPLEGDPDSKSIESVKSPALAENDVPINDSLKNESIVYRFILWLRSVFASSTVEQLYNDDKLASLFRKLNHEYPGLLNYRAKVLLVIFYEKLEELKKAADFFKPYVNEIYKNIGEFYVYLGSFIVPEVTEQMNNEVDPTNLPLERDVTNELRASLLRKTEDVLKGIPEDKRSNLYACASAVDWLYQLTKLPYERFLSAFSGGAGELKVARFNSVSNELNAFAKILCNGKNIPVEALESIFLYSANKIVPIDSTATDDDSRAKEFIDKANSYMMIIHVFITTVPLRYINKIVYENIQWQPEQFAGAEDWFIKYKEQWKKLFEEQWSRWIKERHKNKMNKLLNEHFGISEIPLLPDRPWSTMWGGIPFHFEHTAGFINWFTSQKLEEASAPLKTLLLDGQFVNKDNRAEFANTLNDLEQVSADMYSMAESLSPKGQTGLVFEKLAADHLRSLPAQSKIDSLMLEHEGQIQKIKDSFCACARSILRVLNGIFSEKKDTRYDGIQNLASIQGRDNAVYRKELMESQNVFDIALNLVKELEQIDLPPARQ